MLFFVWYSILREKSDKDNVNDRDELKCISYFINKYIKNANKRLNTDLVLENDITIILFHPTSTEFKGYHFLLKNICKYFTDEIITKRLLSSPFLNDHVKTQLIDITSGTMDQLNRKLRYMSNPPITLNGTTNTRKFSIDELVNNDTKTRENSTTTLPPLNPRINSDGINYTYSHTATTAHTANILNGRSNMRINYGIPIPQILNPRRFSSPNVLNNSDDDNNKINSNSSTNPNRNNILLPPPPGL